MFKKTICLIFVFCLPFCLYAQVVANFSVSSTTGCTPFVAHFNDLSSGNPTQWFWDFGNGTTSVEKNPSVVYYKSGIYSIKLIAKNSTSQDIKEEISFITVSLTPKAAFEIMPDSGCVPLNVNFTNNTDTGRTPIASWLWNFGDGSASTLKSPILHTYSLEGIFNITLTATSAEGCTDTTVLTGGVRTGKPPNANFTATPLDGCGSTSRTFSDLSGGNITSWFWDFGDGGTSIDQNPIYNYTDTGTFSVKLIVRNNGCSDSVQIDNFMHIISPIALIDKEIDCSNPYTITFRNKSIDDKGFEWDFGDGTITSARGAIKHTYSLPGEYRVTLTVKNGACNDSQTDTVYVIDQRPSIEVSPTDSNYCRSDSIQFKAISYDSSTVKAFSWDFGDGEVTAFNDQYSTVTHAYDSTGIYQPLLLFKNKSKCVDTIKTAEPVVIVGPVAEFRASDPVCLGAPVLFTDETDTSQSETVISWEWRYGDGFDDTLTTGSTTHTYAFTTQYNVRLKVTDENGCTDSIIHSVSVAAIPVVDAGLDTNLCNGQSLKLNASGATSYVWDNNADLNCTDCASPLASPEESTVFYVTGKNDAGCAARDSVTITVILKESLTATPLFDTICAGDTINFIASGTDIYQWTPVAGLSNTAIPNPVATPLAPTIYSVIGKDKYGCFSDTANLNILVNPIPGVDITESVITMITGSSHQLQVNYSLDVNKWNWLPADNISCTDCAQPVVTPPKNITYSVEAFTEAGCSNKDSVKIIVVCNNSILFVPNTFSPNADGVNDRFYPRSSNVITIKSLRIFNSWGQKVFEVLNFPTNNSSYGWNGKFNNRVIEPNVFIYIMEIVCANGSAFTQNGSITLLR